MMHALALATLLLLGAQSDETEGPMAPQPEARSWVPDSVVVVEDVVYAEVEDGADGTRPLQLDAAFLRAGRDGPLPAVIYVHGGGWAGGSREMGRTPMVLFALGGYLAVTIDYRLTDVAPFPAQIHDVKAAIRFLRANADDLGIDPDRIGVMGHSAGGHLSALAATTWNVPSLEGEVGSVGVGCGVCCAATLAGPADLTVPLESPLAIELIARLLGPGSEEHKATQAGLASPISHVDGSDPPLLIVHGTADTLVPLDQARRLTDVAVRTGLEHVLFEMEGAGHELRGAADDLRVAAFMDEHLGGSAHEAMLEVRKRLGGTLP